MICKFDFALYNPNKLDVSFVHFKISISYITYIVCLFEKQDCKKTRSVYCFK